PVPASMPRPWGRAHVRNLRGPGQAGAGTAGGGACGTGGAFRLREPAGNPYQNCQGGVDTVPGCAATADFSTLPVRAFREPVANQPPVGSDAGPGNMQHPWQGEPLGTDCGVLVLSTGGCVYGA